MSDTAERYEKIEKALEDIAMLALYEHTGKKALRQIKKIVDKTLEETE